MGRASIAGGPWDEVTVLADVTKRLEAAGIDCMLTGSMALAFFAVPRMTRDLDLVVALDGGHLPFLDPRGDIESLIRRNPNLDFAIGTNPG